MSDLIKHNGSGHLVYQTQRREQFSAVPSQRIGDPSLVIRRLNRRKLLILYVAILVIIPAAIATYLTTPLYRSWALIQINPDPVRLLPLPYRDFADSAYGANYEPYMATQDSILRGLSLGIRVAAKLNDETSDSALRAESDKVFDRFEVARVPNSLLFQISYLAPSPEVAAQVVNIYAEEYIKQHLESRRDTREKARESLQRELEVLEQRVQASESGLVSYAKQKNIVSAAPDQPDLAQSRLAIIDQQIATYETDVIAARTKLETLKKTSIEAFPESLVTPIISQLTSQLLEQEQELTNLRATFGENWPEVIAKRNEVNLLEQQLTRAKRNSLAQTTEQAQQDLRTAQSRLDAGYESLGRQKELVDRYNNALIQYNILQREVETSQNLYDGVLESLRQTSVQAGLEFGNVQVLEPGIPIDEIESPNVLWNMSLASLFGLTLGVGVALIMDYWQNTVSSREEVEELTQLPSLGAIRSDKFFEYKRNGGTSRRKQIAGSSKDVLGLSDNVTAQPVLPPPEVAENVRDVCTSILLSQSDRKLCVIVISSAVPGEGKTTVVRELGRALAEHGAKTLLVETDLRKPDLSEALGIYAQDGLSLFLSGHTASPKIHETDQPNLFVVTAGPKPPNPVVLLSSERMGFFLEDMASSFRFVILDAPPLLAVADARVLGANADGVILVMRARSTSSNLILRAKAVLQNSGTNILGTILNGSDEPRSRYYNRYYTAG